MSKSKKNETPPAVQAVTARKVSPLNGVEPPPEHRFKPGQSGNPGGSRTAGAWMREVLNQMATWKVEDIQEVFDDPASTAAQKGAARVWLDSTSMERSAAGSPIAGAEFDRIADRTEGKATQRVQVDHSGVVAAMDLTRLETDEVATFRLLLAKALGRDLPEVSSLPVLEGPR